MPFISNLYLDSFKILQPNLSHEKQMHLMSDRNNTAHNHFYNIAGLILLVCVSSNTLCFV